jgi:hypothetical protein
MSEMDALKQFAHEYLTGRYGWNHVPRMGLTHFGNIISLILYRKGQFQVELFISPTETSEFSAHRHPDINAFEFPLSGRNVFYVNGEPVYNNRQIALWLWGKLPSQLIPVHHTDWHSGEGMTPYAFLSIQEWLHGVTPSSAGLNWEGPPSCQRQGELLERV